METANTRTGVAVVGGRMAGSGANVALSGRAPYPGRAATRNIHTSRTDGGSA
jgi:hypothetical protein